MSYQIKRTPYFQRMFNNSKRNGQLQRLREEYERIQEFNDRTIEMKMRQVRLKRLFREIEDINESPNVNEYRRHQPLVPMSPEAIQAQQRRDRLLALERARELGQEISRRNAALAETGTGYYLRSELRLTAKMRAVDNMRRDAQERRQRAARRISYGNAQSRSNLERIGQRRLRRQVTAPPPQASLILDTNNQVAQISSPASQLQNLPQFSHMSQLSPVHSQVQTQSQLQADLIRRASMLQQRLEYGNSRSSNNMLRSQRLINCLSISNDAEAFTDEDGHVKLHRAQPLRRRTDGSTDYGFSSDDNNNNVSASETDMQTAMLPPTEPDAIRLEDEGPTTSQNAQYMIQEGQEPLAASITTCDIANLSNAADGATKRWHRISLTVPWVKVMASHPASVPYEVATSEHHQMSNSEIAIAGSELANSVSETTGSTTNYKSSCGATLMQEDLMQIVELDEDEQQLQQCQHQYQYKHQHQHQHQQQPQQQQQLQQQRQQQQYQQQLQQQQYQQQQYQQQHQQQLQQQQLQQQHQQQLQQQQQQQEEQEQQQLPTMRLISHDFDHSIA